MARFGTRWLLTMLIMVNLPHGIINMQNSLAQPGRPSPPQCYIPYEEYDGVVVGSGIQCFWEPASDYQTPTTYILHWMSAQNSGQVKGSDISAYIQRNLFSHSELVSVWVQADNQYGSTSSQVSSFNTANIMKPATPVISHHNQEPLEIYWSSKCYKQGLSEGDCEVRYRADAAHNWSEGEGQAFYSLENVRPYSLYEFQVRCSCENYSSLLSDWSPVYTVEIPGAAPVGQLDVWRDCNISPKSSGCVLIWKTLPRRQALGEVLGYVVMLTHSNSSITVLNASTAEPRGQVVCEKLRCHLNATLIDVTAASVSAYTRLGATIPACLLSANENGDLALQLEITSERLCVSWKPPVQHIDGMKEYVLQYKQVGLPPTQGFDWVRLNKSQISGILTGRFKDYTAYQVALFTILDNGDSYQSSPAIGYVLQGTPSKVPSFKVDDIKVNMVEVSWKPIPLAQRRGIILYYQIGLDSQKEHTLSEPVAAHEKMTYVFKQLSPGQEYEAWIRAVTKAGPGPKATKRFKSRYTEGFDYRVLSVLSLLIPFLCLTSILIKKLHRIKTFFCLKKVPDPCNSQVVQQMNLEVNNNWDCNCVHIGTSDPILSQLEVIMSYQDEMTDGHKAMVTREDGVREAADGEESQNTFGIEEYSKMVDSDDDSVNNFPYEKHFMPTALDML